MKKLVLITISLLIVLPLLSQRPPGKVRKSFEAMVPEARNVKWTMPEQGVPAKEKEYTADYNIDSDSLLTRFDGKGNWVMTITFITIDDLPEAVIKSITSKYMNAKITKAARLEEPGFDGYGVVYTYMKDNWTVQIDKDGFIVRRKLKSDGFKF